MNACAITLCVCHRPGRGHAAGGKFARVVERTHRGREAEAPLELFDTSGCRCHRAPAPLPSPSRIFREAAAPVAPRLAPGHPRRPRSPRLRRTARPGGPQHAPELPFSVSTTAGGMALRGRISPARAGRTAPASFQPGLARYLPQQQVLDIQQALGFRAVGHHRQRLRQRRQRDRPRRRPDCHGRGRLRAHRRLRSADRTGLRRLRLPAGHDDRPCRPFDLNRSGLLIGEAAAFLVLESERRATTRACRFCRLTGYGHTTDFFHLTQPQPNGARWSR
jgi:hypothetical protein